MLNDGSVTINNKPIATLEQIGLAESELDSHLQNKKASPLFLINPKVDVITAVDELMGIPGLLSKTDTAEINKIILRPGESISPFRPGKESFSYIFPIIGQFCIRVGGYRSRQDPHVIDKGKIAKIEGPIKRGVESADNTPAMGYLVEVNTSKFDSLSLADMALPFTESANLGRSEAAKKIIYEVSSGFREPMAARDIIESWIHEISTLDS